MAQQCEHLGRMVTQASLAMKAVVAQLQPVLKSAGFRKRSNTFNRTVEPGLVQVVNFQRGRVDPPGTIELLGLHDLSRHFVMNLGVFIEEAWRLEEWRFGPDGPPARKDWVSEADCQARRRLDNLAEMAVDRCWALDDPGVGPALIERLRDDAFAWFDRLGSRAAILLALESAPSDFDEVLGVGPVGLLATRMCLGAGDRQRAQEHFADWVTDCRAEVAAKPHVGAHLEYLSELAVRNGLTMPAADQAG